MVANPDNLETQLYVMPELEQVQVADVRRQARKEPRICYY